MEEKKEDNDDDEEIERKRRDENDIQDSLVVQDTMIVKFPFVPVATFALADAQSTGLVQRPPLPYNTARWRCRPLNKNMTAHYNSQFFVSFYNCCLWKA